MTVVNRDLDVPNGTDEPEPERADESDVFQMEQPEIIEPGDPADSQGSPSRARVVLPGRDQDAITRLPDYPIGPIGPITSNHNEQNAHYRK